MQSILSIKSCDPKEGTIYISVTPKTKNRSTVVRFNYHTSIFSLYRYVKFYKEGTRLYFNLSNVRSQGAYAITRRVNKDNEIRSYVTSISGSNADMLSGYAGIYDVQETGDIGRFYIHVSPDTASIQSDKIIKKIDQNQINNHISVINHTLLSLIDSCSDLNNELIKYMSSTLHNVAVSKGQLYNIMLRCRCISSESDNVTKLLCEYIENN